MISFKVLALDEGDWTLNTTHLDYPSIKSLPRVCYVFPDTAWGAEGFYKNESVRRHFLQDFEVPSLLLSSACYDGNGYFGYHPTYTKEGKLRCCNIWFRVLVKLVSEGPDVPDQVPTKKKDKPSPRYVWYEMTFFTRWTPESCVTLCLNTPEDTAFELNRAMMSEMRLDLLDPFSMYVPLLDHIVKLYDESVWNIRDMIRPIEKERERRSDFEVDFSLLQEISRHSIHVGEVLSVAIETSSSLRQSHRTLLSTIPEDEDRYTVDRNHTNQYLRFQTQIMKNLKLRQQSNHDRLHAEITMAFNMITQQDSRTLRTDSKAMKTVAILTMIYLPASLTSSIFGMNFFEFTPGDGSKTDAWRVSSNLWIFWLIAALLTATTLMVWVVWQYCGFLWGYLSWEFAKQSFRKVWMEDKRKQQQIDAEKENKRQKSWRRAFTT